jgi:ATP-dependent RNA helicase RhlE
MKLPLSVEIAPSGTAAEGVTQELYIVRKERKLSLLKKILEKYRGAVLLFSRTKHNAKKITRSLRELRFSAAEIHSDRSLAQRRDALEGFRSGRYKILVATDIASRGIDVMGIELVVNYDLPDDSENYVHRIGRTGRAGQKGHAISFAGPDQKHDVLEIEKIIKSTIKIADDPEFCNEPFIQPRGGSRHFKPHKSFGRRFSSGKSEGRSFGSEKFYGKRFSSEKSSDRSYGADKSYGRRFESNKSSSKHFGPKKWDNKRG